MSWFRSWISSNDTPRWFIALSFVLSTVVSIGVGKWTDGTKRVDDNRTQQIKALQDSMVQFQIFVSALSSEMFDKNKVSEATKNDLIKNLNEQFARSRMIEGVIPNDERIYVSDYRYAITKMIDATRQIGTLGEMSEFWSTASKLLVARNRINAKLNSLI